MTQETLAWTRAWLVGIVSFLPWKFFFASPSHLNSFGLLGKNDLGYLLFGAACAMLGSSLFLCYPISVLKNKKRLALSIFNHLFRLSFCYLFAMSPAQIYAWTCWNKDTYKNWLVYTYNTLRDSHYLKAINLGATCPPDVLKKGLIMNDIELERLERVLSNQDYECGRSTASLVLILVVLYILFCNVVPIILGTIYQDPPSQPGGRKIVPVAYTDEDHSSGSRGRVREVDVSTLTRHRNVVEYADDEE